MSTDTESIFAAEAARRLGVSVKALRLYEHRGLLQPMRTEVGYRRYSPDDLRTAKDIVALRSLGLTIAQTALAVKGDSTARDQALALREAELGADFSEIQRASELLRELRRSLAAGLKPRPGDLADALGAPGISVSFDLPWPWGGEPFTFQTSALLTYLVGPLGSGKTRLALRLSEELPEARYLGLQRLDPAGKFESTHGLAPNELAAMEQQLDWLREAGAVDLEPLRVLLAALAADDGRHPLVIDMIEAGLTRPSQEALMPLLRRNMRTRKAPVIAMTRSSSVLDLANVRPGESILYCPANHSLPFFVPPFAGAVGYESLSLCLSTPEVRERIALQPEECALTIEDAQA